MIDADELPEGWAIASGEDLFRFIRGVSFKKEDARSAPGQGTVAVLRAGNLQGGSIILDDLVYVEGRFVGDEQRLRQGDLVVAMSSGSASVVGKVSHIAHDLPIHSFGAFCGLLFPL